MKVRFSFFSSSPSDRCRYSFLVIDSRRKRPRDVSSTSQSGGPPSTSRTTSLFEEKAAKKGAKAAARLTHAQLRELEAKKEREVLRGWGVLKESWSAMLRGEDRAIVERWMEEAGRLVEFFRETRNLFLTSRVCWVYWLASFL